MIITFDTHEYMEGLIKGGFTAEQADTLVKAQKKVINESMESQLATKGDVVETKTDISDVKTEIILVKARLAIIEKVQWIVVSGVIAIVLKSYFL